VPMSLGLGESGQQTAPLARAVIGGLAVATFATLFVLPSVFAVIQGQSSSRSASLHPDDPDSPNFDGGADQSTDRNGVGRPAPLFVAPSATPPS